MRIAVCVKAVPDPKTAKNITIDPVDKTIRREEGAMIINPLDRNAIETALLLREKEGGEVFIFAMAPPSAKMVLRETLALGADKAFLLSDRIFRGSDTLATANILSAGLKLIGADRGWDIILLGEYSSDGGTSQVPAQIGEWLGIPHFHCVRRIDFQENWFSFCCENGKTLDKWKAKAPLVLSVTRKINKPRYTTFRGIVNAKNKEIVTLNNSDLETVPEFLGLNGSPTKYGDIYPVSVTRQGERLTGSKEEIVAALLKKLSECGVLNCKGG